MTGNWRGRTATNFECQKQPGIAGGLARAGVRFGLE